MFRIVLIKLCVNLYLSPLILNMKSLATASYQCLHSTPCLTQKIIRQHFQPHKNQWAVAGHQTGKARPIQNHQNLNLNNNNNRLGLTNSQTGKIGNRHSNHHSRNNSNQHGSIVTVLHSRIETAGKNRRPRPLRSQISDRRSRLKLNPLATIGQALRQVIIIINQRLAVFPTFKAQRQIIRHPCKRVWWTIVTSLTTKDRIRVIQKWLDLKTT